MKPVKVLLILVLIFGISYSCSTVKPLGSAVVQKESQIIQPVVVNTTTKDTTIVNQSNFKTDFQIALDNAMKSYKEDNARLEGRFWSLRLFMDSLARTNANMYKLNNDLLFKQMISNQNEQSSKDRLLLEKEKNSKLSQAYVKTKTQIKEGERYMATFLTVGVVVNILMTIGLFFYKRASFKQLKKMNLIHA